MRGGKAAPSPLGGSQVEEERARRLQGRWSALFYLFSLAGNTACPCLHRRSGTGRVYLLGAISNTGAQRGCVR